MVEPTVALVGKISCRISWRGTIIKSTGGGGCTNWTTCALPTYRAPVVYPAAGGSGRVHEWLYTIFQPGGPTKRTSLLLLVDWKPPSNNATQMAAYPSENGNGGHFNPKNFIWFGVVAKRVMRWPRVAGVKPMKGADRSSDPPKGNSKET